MATQAETRLLRPVEVAEQLAVTRKTIYRLIDRGALPALHAGRQLRVDPTDFRRWLEGGTE